MTRFKCRPALLLTAVLGLSACGRDSNDGFGGFWHELPKTEAAQAGLVRSATEADMLSCAAEKCLTVYVAPWCPYCRASTPVLLSLRDLLHARGIPMRFVVGLDRREAVAAYARALGPETLADPEGRFVSGGVPHFYVRDRSGRLMLDQAGVPAGMDDPRRLGELLGLL